MTLTNELAGRLILWGIIVFCIVTFCIYGIILLKMNYKWRKQGIRDYQNSVYYSAILMLIWIFTSIPNLLDKYAIDPLFNKSLKDGLSAFPFITACLIVAYIAYFLHKKIVSNGFHLQLKYSLLLLTIGVIYWNHRFDGPHEFFPILKGDKWSDIKILDLPFILYSYFVIVLLFHSLFQWKDEHSYREIITTDRPLESIDDDEYERAVFYKSLIDTIKSNATNHKKSLSIGIVNRWGEGKTSFLEFVKKELRKDDSTIVVEFNPWYSTNTNNLTLDFFQTLDYKISKYIYTGSILRKYAKSLTNINSVFNPFKYLPDKWIGNKSNQQYFEDINKLINTLDKRIVVIIDDLDRLDNKEVFSIFQVIRNSADFSNTMFIIPFDKDYVIKSLTENRIPKPDEYLKKMFDVELALPAISKLHLINVFKNHFKISFKKLINLTEEDEKKLNEQIVNILLDTVLICSIVPKYSVLNKFFFNHFKNKRDLIRYINSAILSLRDSHHIIYLPDFLILELIKYLNIDIYRKLFESRDYLRSESDGGSFIKTNVLLQKEEANHAEKSTKSLLKTTINDYNIRIDVTTGMRIDVADLIEELFKEPKKNDFKGKYSMHYRQNYSNYHQFIKGSIKQDEIKELVEKNGQE